MQVSEHLPYSTKLVLWVTLGYLQKGLPPRHGEITTTTMEKEDIRSEANFREVLMSSSFLVPLQRGHRGAESIRSTRSTDQHVRSHHTVRALSFWCAQCVTQLHTGVYTVKWQKRKQLDSKETSFWLRKHSFSSFYKQTLALISEYRQTEND